MRWVVQAGCIFPRTLLLKSECEKISGVQPPALTSGPLSDVPIVVGLWPVLLTGIYAISRRKEKIAQEELNEAVASTVSNANEEMKVKLAELKDKMTKQKEAAINLEVKKALKEAAEYVRRKNKCHKKRLYQKNRY